MTATRKVVTVREQTGGVDVVDIRFVVEVGGRLQIRIQVIIKRYENERKLRNP